jgi:hypothetical protein
VSEKPQVGLQHIGIGSVLKQNWLAVPPNQREYRWTDVEVTKLFQDLAKAIGDRAPEYFLGTIVTIPKNGTLEVVDGQQRLATVAMFLCEIRNYLKEKDSIVSQGVIGFLTDIDRNERVVKAKLSLNYEDNEFFSQMIRSESDQERPQPKKNVPSHELIKIAFDEARKQIGRIVSPLDPRNHGDELNKWINFIERDAHVILLTAPTGLNAYKMFETLNDRGLKTTQADLVKSYLFEQADAGKRLLEAHQKWARMRGSLESLEEDDITITFLRHALTAIGGYLEEADVYEEVQRRAKGAANALSLIDKLEDLATTYVATFNPEDKKWNQHPDSVGRAIRALNLFNIKPLRPLMLAVASRFTPNETAESFRMFISWSVRLLIASSTRSGSVIEPLGNQAHAVYVGKTTDSKKLRDSVADVIPKDETFRQAFEVATVSKSALARYYLRSLELAAKNEPTPWFWPVDDKQTINLEHILPEKTENNWPQFSSEQAEAYLKRIGNLALMQAKTNSDMRSAGFEAKREIYRNTPYILTSQIAEVQQWTPETIVERQKGLARLALTAWPL